MELVNLIIVFLCNKKLHTDDQSEQMAKVLLDSDE